MVSVHVLSDSEKSEIRERLDEFANKGDEDLMPFVYENEVSDGFAEVRFFPAPEHGPPTSMEFEVTVLDGSDEFRGNMKNSDDRIYTQLAEELEEVVANELGGRLALTRSNYTGTFSGSVEL